MTEVKTMGFEVAANQTAPTSEGGSGGSIAELIITSGAQPKEIIDGLAAIDTVSGQPATVIEYDGVSSGPKPAEDTPANAEGDSSKEPKGIEQRVSEADAEITKTILADMGTADKPINMETVQKDPKLQAKFARQYSESMKTERAKIKAEMVNIAKDISFDSYVAEHPMPDPGDKAKMAEWKRGVEEHNKMFDQVVSEMPEKDELQLENDDVDEDGNENDKANIRKAFKLAIKYLGENDDGKKEIEQEVEKINKNHPDFKGRFVAARILIVGFGMAAMAGVSAAVNEATKATSS